MPSDKVILDGVAAALHGWPDLNRNAYVPGQVSELRSERDALLQRVAELERDAKRYRWIASKAFGEGDPMHWSLPYIPGRHPTFDAAIDSALEAKP